MVKINLNNVKSLRKPLTAKQDRFAASGNQTVTRILPATLSHDGWRFVSPNSPVPETEPPMRSVMTAVMIGGAKRAGRLEASRFYSLPGRCRVGSASHGCLSTNVDRDYLSHDRRDGQPSGLAGHYQLGRGTIAASSNGK